jgi:hypothetical protein
MVNKHFLNSLVDLVKSYEYIFSDDPGIVRNFIRALIALNTSRTEEDDKIMEMMNSDVSKWDREGIARSLGRSIVWARAEKEDFVIECAEIVKRKISDI